jgi:hypothetical protein
MRHEQISGGIENENFCGIPEEIHQIKLKNIIIDEVARFLLITIIVLLTF